MNTTPKHYGGEGNPFEPVKIIEHYGLDFFLGNAIKYICRAGKKDGEDYAKDLRKAIHYLSMKVGNGNAPVGARYVLISPPEESMGCFSVFIRSEPTSEFSHQIDEDGGFYDVRYTGERMEIHEVVPEKGTKLIASLPNDTAFYYV
jgi:hypothetical protein